MHRGRVCRSQSQQLHQPAKAIRATAENIVTKTPDEADPCNGCLPEKAFCQSRNKTNALQDDVAERVAANLEFILDQ